MANPATQDLAKRIYAKARPGELNYQAPLGSYSHLDMLALTAAAGVKMVHLPSTRTSSPAA